MDRPAPPAPVWCFAAGTLASAIRQTEGAPELVRRGRGGRRLVRFLCQFPKAKVCWRLGASVPAMGRGEEAWTGTRPTGGLPAAMWW
jgi:hypothetical protein